MSTLLDIINSKNEIITLAKNLGFVNVRIYRDFDSNHLNFLVDKDPNNENADAIYADSLAALLIEKLNCQVNVRVNGAIKDLYKETILANYASLDDEAEITKLYAGKSPEQVIFSNIDYEENNAEELKALQEDGRKFITENLQRIPQLQSSPTLFHPSKRRGIETDTTMEKKPKFELNRHLQYVALIMPIPQDMQYDESKMLNQETAEELALLYFSKLKNPAPRNDT